ncbi:MAG: tripartite tricarboxylate transporter permease [Desulfobacula sp.]|uniref:tripartite tricarboxylate transporter permease n=1 Tax=Desulfobacula sp. TaxID=2593537 RepID=UPI0025C359EF|nr:tripartite tricarboxylate transporter permease [Desulfobacula sp.]MCD4720528.1 tripartite tricarboxylate transporter permease [Desulfobacula sp.]
MFDLLFHGFSVALSGINPLLVVIGCFLGTIIGMLPGIGPINAIAILFPIVLQFDLPPSSALIFFAGIFYGSQYGNSISSILLNVPGTSSAAVTCIDGHPLAKQGRAGPALAMSAMASFIGGTISIFLLIFFAPYLSKLAIDFGPAEYFVLMVCAFTALSSFSEGSFIKAMFSAFLGLAIATVGIDELSFGGMRRFTFGIRELGDGIDFIVVVIGVFAVGELFLFLSDTAKDASQRVIPLKKVLLTFKEIKESIGGILRSCVTGFLVGVLPGAGATIASFLAYNTEKKLAGTKGNFGKGDLRGVAAPESANNSSAVGSFIPLLVLGVPGSETTAVMLAVLITLGVTPGPTMLVDRPDMFWGVAASMFIGNLVLIVLNLPMVRLLAKILLVPRWILMPLIAILSIVGVYVINGSEFDLILMLVFGVVGFLMRKTGFPLAPLVLGLVLGGLIEVNFRRALTYSYGDFSTFYESPIAIALWLITLASLVAPVLFRFVKKRLRQ